MCRGNKKKIILIIAAAVIFAAVILGVFLCLRGNNEHLIYRGSTSAVISQNREERKTLRVGVSSAPDTVHPYLRNDDAMQVLSKLVFEPLIYINNDGETEYINAKDIVFKDKGRTAVVKLNKRKKFSNKAKLTAENVLKSYQYFINETSDFDEIVENIVNIEIQDEETLVFYFVSADIDNIKTFTMPIVYKPKNADDNSTMLGTGIYKISEVGLYENIVLERNKNAKKRGKYKKIELKPVDINEIENQKYDVFLFNRDSLKEIKELDAYDIYEFGMSYGWFMRYNINNKNLIHKIANIANEKGFVKNNFDEGYGVDSKGIVFAFKDKPNYYSNIDEGQTDGISELTFRYNQSNGTSMLIYELISSKLSEENITCNEPTDATGDLDKGFTEDVEICYGNYKDIFNDTDKEDFFEAYDNLNAEDYYDCMEKYFASLNVASPISKDAYYVASLAGKNNLDLVELCSNSY